MKKTAFGKAMDVAPRENMPKPLASKTSISLTKPKNTKVVKPKEVKIKKKIVL